MNDFKKRMGAATLGCLLSAGLILTPAAAGAPPLPSATYEMSEASVPDTAVRSVPAVAETTTAQTAVRATDTSYVPVRLGGEEVANRSAVLKNGLTYVPLRYFCTYITGGSAAVTWNASSRVATVTTSTLTLTAGEGKTYLTANGRCFYTAGAILNLGGTLYVPLRPLAKAFGLDVAWDTATRSVTLTGNPRTYVLPSAEEVYDADELYWLSRIISAEARGEPFTGQIAVGNVVLNRCASREFPNSIWGVIFDRKHGTQFTPVASGTIYQTPTASSVTAAKICLEGYSISTQALYFFNPKIATSSWISRNCTYLFTIGTHQFYK